MDKYVVEEGTAADRLHVSELARNWVQVVALFVAAIWAISTFAWIQFWQPRQVPVNISLNLELQKVPAESVVPLPVPTNGNGHPLVAVELSVKATNPSSRTIILLPSAWLARGYRVRPSKARLNLSASAADLVQHNGIRPVEKYAEVVASEAIAGGRLFTDDVLKPSETIARRVVFHVPPGYYDVVEVYTNVPSTDRQKIGVIWRPDGDTLRWQITRDGVPLPEVKPGDKPSDEYQTSVSRAAMSLWRQ